MRFSGNDEPDKLLNERTWGATNDEIPMVVEVAGSGRLSSPNGLKLLRHEIELDVFNEFDRLLTELGENSIFLESELEQMKREISFLRNIYDVRHLHPSTKYRKKFYLYNLYHKPKVNI